MGYKVLLVDDEPGAIRFLAHIISSQCPGWEIAGRAENGRQAFDCIKKSPPDAVLTDIRMPVMDGVALAKQIKEKWPDIHTVLVSGYEDFEAAQNAIRYGVSEYILKPVRPAQLVAIMEQVRGEKLEQTARDEAAFLAAALAGEKPDAEKLKRLFPQNRFYAAIVRKGSLPSRYSTGISASPTPERLRGGANCWTAPGRDEWERLIIQINPVDLEENALSAARGIPGEHYTIIRCHEPFPLSQAYEMASKLMRQVEKSHVLGVSQLLAEGNQAAAPVSVNAAMEMKIVGMCTGFFRTMELRELLHGLFISWVEARQPLHYVYKDLERLMGTVERGLNNRRNRPADFDQELEAAVLLSRDMEELRDRIWNLVLAALRRAENQDAAPGSDAFFDKICEYIEQNLASRITLPTICAAMGISQTYMSRIFRRSTKASFNEYLTERRLLKAKEMMREKPELSLKTVAELTGFKDPNYFSKVFRAAEGMPPSQFLAVVESDTNRAVRKIMNRGAVNVESYDFDMQP